MSQEEKKTTGRTPNGGKRIEKTPRDERTRTARSVPPKRKPTGESVERTGRAKALHTLYITLTVVSAIIVAAYVFWKIFAAPPSVDPNDPTRPGVSRPPVVITTEDPEHPGQQIEIELPALSGDRKERFYTFLMVGQSQDEGGKLTDTMMLAAYDVPNQKLSVMSLPRDTYVRCNGRVMLLNGVYNAAGGYRDDEKGIQGLKKAVQELTGVYPDFHAVIQWEALGELVDAIGGVEFEVPFDMYYNDLSQGFKIDLKKGLQTLDGEGAMGLVRWRHNSDDSGHISKSYGYAEGDIGRIKTQQAFLKQVIKKCLQPDVLLPNLAEYIGIFQRNVVTNLTAGELAYFAQSAVGGLDMDNVTFTTLPYVDAGDGAHLIPVGSRIVAAVNEGFNPYEEDIHQGELKLATLDDVPRRSASPAPEESSGPDESPGPDDPDESPGPEESEEPNEGETVLPPGVVVQPSSRPSPSASPGASAPPPSARPAESPSASPGPSESPPAEPSASPASTPAPTETPGPAATPAPTPEPAPEEEPLLPPGV